MSRIGRLPITLPKGVTVAHADDEVTVKGPKGELRHHLNSGITVNLENNVIKVARSGDSKEQKALHGLTRALLANMVLGVTSGFQKELEIVGVGFRAEKAGDKVVLRLGFTHPVEVKPTPGISMAVEGTNKIKLTGIDKGAVGLAAARLRALRPADHYKGKGLKYTGEAIRIKPGKAGKAVGK